MSLVRRILAPNPGPFTLDGTNTWIVGDRGGPCIVIDPGPPDGGHLRRVAIEAGRVGAILLTHRHLDHAPGAALLAAETGAPVFAFSPEPGERPIASGQEVAASGAVLVAVHTPGHSGDHLAFHGPSDGTLFTGDAVLGRGTSVVDPPDGDMALYMDSLEAMLALSPRVIHPGHGPAVADAMGKLREYAEHRRAREEQVLDALARAAEPCAAEDLAGEIYAGHPPELQGAAVRSVLAHLLKLEREGAVERAGGEGTQRFRLHTAS